MTSIFAVAVAAFRSFFRGKRALVLYALKHPIPIGANLSLSMGVAGEDS